MPNSRCQLPPLLLATPNKCDPHTPGIPVWPDQILHCSKLSCLLLLLLLLLFPFPVALQLIPRLVLGLLRNSHCISSGSIGNKFQFAGLPGRESDSQPGPGSAPCPPSSLSLSVPVSASLGCLATMQCGGKMIKIRLHSGVKLTYIAAIYPFARYTLQMGQHRSRNWLCWRQH